jgi:hypothetical protein
MKTKTYRPLIKNAIPDGEGFIALPISFNSVIASDPPRGERSNLLIAVEIASRRLAMTKYKR